MRTGVSDMALVVTREGTGTFLPMTFQTGGSERLRIDTAGNVGIGTNNPGVYGKLEVAGSGYTATAVRSSDASGVIVALAANAADGARLNVLSNHPLQFFTNNTERMRLDSSGNLLVGTTSVVGASGAGRLHVQSADGSQLHVRNNSATAGRRWEVGADSSNSFIIYNQDGTGQYMTNGGTSWNANSDERLKTDLKPILDAAAKVSTLRAVTGRYKTDNDKLSRAFLIAQDVQKVLPEAVNVQNDAEGTLGLAYTETIPLLVAAIQEQQAIITALTARVAALESN
jgi:hypothetical protein